MAIKLYDSSRSPNARKIRLIAAELGIVLERVTVGLMQGEHRAPEYLAKNPNGRVPAIDDDGFVLWESAAILKYLAAKQPEKNLIFADPKEQAHLDQWMFWWAAHPEAALLLLIYERRVKPFLNQGGNDPSIIREAETALDRFLPVLEQQLDGKQYILGRLSAVDFQVSPWLEIASAAGVDLSRYPNLMGLLKRMQEKPYWNDT